MVEIIEKKITSADIKYGLIVIKGKRNKEIARDFRDYLGGKPFEMKTNNGSPKHINFTNDTKNKNTVRIGCGKDFYKDRKVDNVIYLRIIKDENTIVVTDEKPEDTEYIEIISCTEEEERIDELIDLLEYKHQIILQGPPGTGKTRLAKLIAEEITGKTEDQEDQEKYWKIIQFHPAYSYEDFVRGIITKSNNGQIEYVVEDKILAKIAKDAENDAGHDYVLIIDEINRANLPAVLGELIYALEYRGKSVDSMYELNDSREIKLPENLFIIGTMNTADRSVGHIDYAIRRRFAFVDVLVDKNVIKNKTAEKLFEKVENMFSESNLSPDFKEKDVMIGHSYFRVKDEDEDEDEDKLKIKDEDKLKIKLEYEIKPILREYLKDGIFSGSKLKELAKEIENLTE